MNRKRRPFSPARAAMKLLCLVLGLILAVMLAATVIFQPTLEGLSNLKTFPGTEYSDQGIFSDLSFDRLNELFSGKNTAIGGPGSRIINILLVGQDYQEGEAVARSDSMILCTFQKAEKKLIMTSFLRDLYVQIPGYGSNRLNAAYAFGGTKLLEQTLEQNFDLYIDGCVEVDFSHFAQIVDTLGGVELDLREDEAALISEETGTSISAGVQTLSGFQALTYARIRKLDANGDFSRTNRQRKMMSAILQSCKQLSMSEMLSLLNVVLPMIQTDLSGIRILSLAVELFPMLRDAQTASQHIPAEGAYTDKNIDHMAVLVPDLDAAQSMLRQTLLGGNID